MKAIIKAIVIILFLAGAQAHAQDYPKYRTTKAQTTARPAAKQEKTEIKAVDTPQPYEKNEDDFEALMVKAIAFSNAQKYPEALEVYGQAITISNPDNVYRAIFGRGTVYFRMKEYDKALTGFTDIIENRKLPNENVKGQAYNMRCLTHKIMGNKKDACTDYKMARELGVLAGGPMPGFEDCQN